MANDEFDLKILELEKKNDALLENSEEIVRKFISSVQKTIENWAPAFIENVVKSQKAVTKSLGVEGVRSVKQKTPEIVATLPAILAEKLDNSKAWTHRLISKPETRPENISRSGHTFTNPADIENSIYHDHFSNNNYHEIAPPTLLSIYREAQTDIINFLKDFGYQAFLPKSTHTNDHTDKMFPVDVTAILKEYKENHGARYTVMKEIEAVKAQKESAEVELIWNEA